MDGLGDHVLCCSRLGIYARHNEVRNEFGSLCMDMGLQVVIEAGPVDTTERPADVIKHYALTQQCSKAEAAVTCRTRLALALVRGLARQLERGFPACNNDIVDEDFDDFYSF